MNDHEPSDEVRNEALYQLLDMSTNAMLELAALAEFKTAGEAIKAIEQMPDRQMRRMLLAYAHQQQGVYGNIDWQSGALPDLGHWLD